jgi:hypothetical protein
MNSHPSQRSGILLTLLTLLWMFSLPVSFSAAVSMEHDPNGFQGIRWGTTFAESADFVVVENGKRIKAYELKQGPLALGLAKVDSMRFFTLDGRFARVVIRYHDRLTHDRIVAYFQSMFGPLDKTPGQITKGPVQQLYWLGEETEIVVTYRRRTDRGIIFIEHSPTALKFSEGMMAPDPDLGGATY